MKRKLQYATVHDRWYSRKTGEMSREHPDHPDQADPAGARRRARYLVEWGASGDRQRAVCRTRQEADYKARQLNNEHDAGATGRRGEVTFEVWTRRYYANKKDYAYNSAVRNRIYSDIHLFPALGPTKLRDLTASHIEDMRDHFWSVPGIRPDGKPRKALANSTQKGLLREVIAILNHAVARGEVATNVARSVSVAPDDHEMEVLTGTELLAIQAHAGERYQLLFKLSIVTGLRISELLGLTHDDFRWADGEFIVTVHRQLALDWRKGQLWTPLKAARKAGERRGAARVKIMALPDELADDLLAYREQWGTGPQGLVFRSRRSAAEPLSHSTASKQWVQASEAALGRRTKARWHNGRHFMASSMAANGDSLIEVAAQLGNSPQVVADTYAHLFTKVQRGGRAAIAALTGASKPRKLRVVKAG